MPTHMSRSFAARLFRASKPWVSGFRHIDLMRRDLGDEVEFVTIMWFDDLDSIKAFVGDDYEVSHVPAAARAVLSRHDDRSAHYDVVDRRPQP